MFDGRAAFGWILRHPWWVMGAVGLVTLVLGWHASRIRFDNSIEALLPAGHPAVLQDREIKEEFASRELVLVGLLSADGIFNHRTLSKVTALSREIRRLEIADEAAARRLADWGDEAGSRYRSEVASILRNGLDISDRGAVDNLRTSLEAEGAPPQSLELLEELSLRLRPVSDVLSLGDVEDITVSASGLDVGPPMPRVPRDREAMARLVARTFDNEMFVGGLVSADSTGTVVLVEMSFHYDDHYDMARDLLDELEALSARYAGPEEIRLAGVPMVNVHTSEYMGRDLARLMPVVLLVLVGVLYAAFRWWRGVFIPLAVVLVAVTWTLGTMQLLGRPVTLVVSAMPVILVAVGVADGVHLVSEYQALHGKLGDKRAAILATMDALAAPILFTSLTDMAGFGALAISSLASIRDFGVFTSLGVLAALVFSLTFVPAAMVVMKEPPPRAGRSAMDPLRTWMDRLAQSVAGHRRAVVLTSLAASVAALAALPGLRVGSSMVGYFQEDSEIFRASEMINEKFGGTEVLNIIVDTGRPDGLMSPEVLAKVAALQDTLEARTLVGYTTSIADYVKRIHRMMNGGDPSFARIPAQEEPLPPPAGRGSDDGGYGGGGPGSATVPGRQLVAQYLLLYENAGGDDLESLADFDYRKANVVAQIRTDHTPHLREIRQVARDYATRELAGTAEVTFAGCSNLCIVGDELIIPSQLRSLGIAVLMVLALLVSVFRSVRMGLLGLLPLGLTILAVFALLSAFGIYLDSVTALIASIVLGIGIDYSVHFVSRYRRALEGGAPEGDAVRTALTASGPAIVFNSLAVAAGFLVLVLSSFWPVIHIGWIVAVTMVVAALLTLTLLPAILSRAPGPARASGEGGA